MVRVRFYNCQSPRQNPTQDDFGVSWVGWRGIIRQLLSGLEVVGDGRIMLLRVCQALRGEYGCTLPAGYFDLAADFVGREIKN